MLHIINWTFCVEALSLARGYMWSKEETLYHDLNSFCFFCCFSGCSAAWNYFSVVCTMIELPVGGACVLLLLSLLSRNDDWLFYTFKKFFFSFLLKKTEQFWRRISLKKGFKTDISSPSVKECLHLHNHMKCSVFFEVRRRHLLDGVYGFQ